jgi:tetratricopeptide (TPR) repeat protein
MYLAMVYEETGELQEAIKESEAFVELFPESWVGFAYLAELYKKDSHLEASEIVLGKAINTLTTLVARGSKDEREYLALAQLLIARERRDEAIRVLKSGLNTISEEKSKDIRLLLANLYYEANHYEGVENELKAILKLDPDSHEASNFLGYFYAERGKELDEALKLVEKALQAQPNNGAYIDSLGWVYYKLATEGDALLEQALQELIKASKETPDPEIFKHLGEVYYSLGQWETAKAEWQKALQTEPTGQKDKQILLWIQEKLRKLDLLEKLEAEELQEEQPGI